MSEVPFENGWGSSPIKYIISCCWPRYTREVGGDRSPRPRVNLAGCGAEGGEEEVCAGVDYECSCHGEVLSGRVGVIPH